MILKDGNNNQMEDKDMLIDHIKFFYKTLFHDYLKDRLSYTTENSFPFINDKQNEMLTKCMSNLEVRRAMFLIGGFKVPGVDSFPTIAFTIKTSIQSGQVFANS